MFTIQYQVLKFMNSFSPLQIDLIEAGILLPVLIPVLIVFIIGQRWIVEAFTKSGLKG